MQQPVEMKHTSIERYRIFAVTLTETTPPPPTHTETGYR